MHLENLIFVICISICVLEINCRILIEILTSKYSEIRNEEIKLIGNCINYLWNSYSAGRSLIFMSDQINSDLSDYLIREMNQGLKIITSINNVSENIGFFLFFVQENKDSNFAEILEKIPPNNVMRFVVVLDFQEKIDLRHIQKILEEFWTYQIIDVITIVPFRISKNIRIYTYHPFSATRCGETGPPILINVWNSQNKAFLNQLNLFSRNKKVISYKKFYILYFNKYVLLKNINTVIYANERFRLRFFFSILIQN